MWSEGVGVLHFLGVESRHGEVHGELIDALANVLEGFVGFEHGGKVLELGSGLFLELEGGLEDLVQKLTNLFKVLLAHLTGGQGGSTDADTSGGDGGSVTGDAVLVEGDADVVAGLFVLGSGDSIGLEVPQDQVVFGSSRGHLVTVLRLEEVGKGGGVGLDLLGVDLEFGGHDFLELGGDTGDLVLVGSTLEGGEDGLVDFVLETTVVLSEEDHTGTGSTEGLVGGGGDDVAVVKRRGLFASGDQSGNVCHVHHQKGSVGVSDFSELSVVPVTWVGRSSADDHGGFEETGKVGELFVVDVSGFGMDAVGKRFKVYRSGRDGFAGSFLLGVGVESVRQVSTAGKVESHDSIVGTEKGRVDGEVGGRSRVWLDVDAPLFGVQSVGLEGTILAHGLDLINDLISSVVTGAGKTLRVLVRQCRSKTFHDGLGGEVLRGNQFQRTPLAILFLFDQIVQFGIVIREGDETCEFLSVGRSVIVKKRVESTEFIGLTSIIDIHFDIRMYSYPYSHPVWYPISIHRIILLFAISFSFKIDFDSIGLVSKSMSRQRRSIILFDSIRSISIRFDPIR